MSLSRTSGSICVASFFTSGSVESAAALIRVERLLRHEADLLQHGLVEARPGELRELLLHLLLRRPASRRLGQRDALAFGQLRQPLVFFRLGVLERPAHGLDPVGLPALGGLVAEPGLQPAELGGGLEKLEVAAIELARNDEPLRVLAGGRGHVDELAFDRLRLGALRGGRVFRLGFRLRAERQREAGEEGSGAIFIGRTRGVRRADGPALRPPKQDWPSLARAS